MDARASAAEVAEKIYAELIKGRPSGPFLHSERALQEQYSAHRSTIANALDLLVRQGKLDKVEDAPATRSQYAIADLRKHVTVISSSPAPFDLPGQIDESGTPIWSDPKIAVEAPDDDIRVMLGMRRSQKTLVHRQYRLIDGTASGQAETWFTPEIAKLAAIPRASDESQIQAAIENAGHLIAHGIDRTGLETATPQQCSDWSIPENKSLIKTVRIVWDNTKAVLYVRVTLLNGAKHEIEHGVPRNALILPPRNAGD